MAAPFDLSGRRAVVTGASRGIGRAISIALARAGADVCGMSLDDGSATDAAVGQQLVVDGGLVVNGTVGHGRD